MKTVAFVIALCGLVGVSAADDSELLGVKLSIPDWVKKKERRFSATLTLEHDTWEDSLSVIRKEIAISHSDTTLSIVDERYSYETWVCTSSCGTFVEFGYWDTRYSTRKKVERVDDQTVRVFLIFEGIHSDIDPDSKLIFIVNSGAIVDYNGRALRVGVPVSLEDNTAIHPISWGELKTIVPLP